MTVQHVFAAPGAYAVRLHVTDNLGLDNSRMLDVTVNPAAGGDATVTVLNQGEGNGQVFSVPDALQCLFTAGESSPPDCSTTLAAGEQLQIVAVADDGFVFSHWGTGNCDSEIDLDGVPACVVSGGADRTVRVYFE